MINKVRKDIDFSDAAVDRDTSGKKLVISWKGQGDSENIDIYWSTKPVDIEQQGYLLQSSMFIKRETTTVTINDPSPTARPYFLLKTRAGSVITVAERRLPLKGTCNFRDLGGYKTVDSKTIRWGKLFRSDDLSKLNKEDIDYLTSLGLKTIVDFRCAGEFTKYPDMLIPGVTRVSLPALSYSGFEDLEKLLAGPPGKSIIDYTIELIIDHGAQESFSEMLKILAQSACFPLDMHCTGGKDRTGVGIAIVLLALGVPEQTVIEDYIISEKYRETENQKVIEAMKLKSILDTDYKCEIFKYVLAARTEYLEEALREMRKHYGSIDAYLETGLGLTKQLKEILKNLLLEDSYNKEN